MAGAGISYKIEYLRINRTCPASTCGIFHTLYEPKFQVALTHRNWTGGLLPVNASSYILGASIQPLAWLCVGCSGLVRVYWACAVFLMHVQTNLFCNTPWTSVSHNLPISSPILMILIYLRSPHLGLNVRAICEEIFWLFYAAILRLEWATYQTFEGICSSTPPRI